MGSSFTEHLLDASLRARNPALSFSSHPHMETRLCPTKARFSSLSWVPRRTAFPSPVCSGRGIGWSYGLERASGRDLSGFRVEALKKP